MKEPDMNRTRHFSCLLALFVLASSGASAQARPDSPKDWFGHFSLSYTQPESDVSDLLDDGYTLSGGATYWPEDWPVGLVFDLAYTDFDMSSSTIREINDRIDESGGSGELTGGSVDVWSLTIGGTWSPSDSGSGFYLLADVGVHSVEGRVEETGLVYYPPICDPWFWWCSPGGVGPGTAVVASDRQTAFGWEVGIGWAWEVSLSGAQVFIEASYQTIETSPVSTSYLPLTIGYQW
jgi:hypothetical protein